MEQLKIWGRNQSTEVTGFTVIGDEMTPLAYVAFESDACNIIRACNSHEKLLESLKAVSAAFEIHLFEKADEEGMPVEQCCPCYENELAEAKQAIAEAEA